MKKSFHHFNYFSIKHPKDNHEVNRIGLWYKPWFYTHVESFLSKIQREDVTKEQFTEFIPTIDYFHRHNKAYFWLVKNQLSCVNDLWFRYVLVYFITRFDNFYFL